MLIVHLVKYVIIFCSSQIFKHSFVIFVQLVCEFD